MLRAVHCADSPPLEFDWAGADYWQLRLNDIQRETDAGVRNHLITRTYHDLSCSMRSLMGDTDANWLSFGTWASRTAGEFIRGEAMPVRWGVESVAAGNLAIIEDIAPCFIAYLADVAGEAGHELVKSGRERISSSDLLQDAFECYDRAIRLPPAADDPIRAQLILRANLDVAYHEQWLADHFIDEAMPLGGIFGIVTTRFVELHLPHVSMDLSAPVEPPAYLNGPMWPTALHDITDERLREMFVRIGHDPQDPSKSGATRWEDFDERMGFIASFFRAYQRDPSLASNPFTDPTA